MTESIGTIAQKALRRLGVRIVPLDDSPVLLEMVTFDTIATAALVELGVIASDEVPIPTDQALMLDKVVSVHAALDAQGVVWWVPGSVPRAFVEDYSLLTAAQAASSFGKDGRSGDCGDAGGPHPQGVRWSVEAATPRPSRRRRRSTMTLSCAGIARWSSLDIPNPVADAMAVLTADSLASLFEVQPDAEAAANAMVAIYRYVALPTSGEVVATAYF